MIEKIVFGMGCFWCSEAYFKRIKGVMSVNSGYSGGEIKNPTYEQVCMGNTGHAEVVEIEYDTNLVSIDTLLEYFFKLHDPTTLNRQGADVGTQYRSVIFYTNEFQKNACFTALKKAQKMYEDTIVTEILHLKNFYKAENYHQNFFENNRNYPYCKIVIQPKIDKLDYI